MESDDFIGLEPSPARENNDKGNDDLEGLDSRITEIDLPDSLL